MKNGRGTQLRIHDAFVVDQILHERKRSGIDRYDEVWDGMYVLASPPTIAQQLLVGDLASIFGNVIKKTGRGRAYAGANVSDRRKGWEHNHRIPDVLVVLSRSRARDCGTHLFGGPDFIVEIESPEYDTEEKVLFFSKIGVRELLIIHRDTRKLRLLRLQGEELVLVKTTSLDGKEWLISEVLPLAFRRTMSKGRPRTQVRRTAGEPEAWTI